MSEKGRVGVLKRLLLIALVGGGVFLWRQGQWFAQERELVFALGADRGALRAVEIQLWTLEGELIRREELFFQSGPGPEIVQKLALKEGVYLARVFAGQSAQGQRAALGQRTVQVGGQDVIHVDLASR